MGIRVDEAQKIFYLESKNTSYMMGVDAHGYLMHLYWGKKIGASYKERFFRAKGRASFSPTPEGDDISLDDMPVEYPTYGRSDYRVPALTVQLEDGSTITDLRYESYEIIQGKPAIQGLPATYVEKEEEAQTLAVTLVDALIGLKVILSYSIYETYDAITRSVRLINEGHQDLKVTQVMSMSVDFESVLWDWMHLYGSWARERHVERAAVGHGVQYIDSKRGASSHNHNPFMALLEKEATEHQGDVYGFSLVYSGNFLAQIEVDQYNNTRVAMGLNAHDFLWRLDQGTTFQTPECVMVYSDKGLGGMSRIYHKLYRERLCRGQYRDTVRPVLVNNWEATYFDFNEQKILDIAKAGKDLGIELFVLDDGWFGKRNGDSSSLGDWFVNKEKLPNGLEGLCKQINDLGMAFGLWFEPEMVSPDSELYRKHPDWCLHVNGRSRTQGRKQLILDLSREDVCQYLIETVTEVLRSCNITYVKWDMNRNMTEIGSALLPARQ
ncbi:MAG: alpha-galactosidase, partial [Cellulosilyticaceae bacterium]